MVKIREPRQIGGNHADAQKTEGSQLFAVCCEDGDKKKEHDHNDRHEGEIVRVGGKHTADADQDVIFEAALRKYAVGVYAAEGHAQYGQRVHPHLYGEFHCAGNAGEKQEIETSCGIAEKFSDFGGA